LFSNVLSTLSFFISAITAYSCIISSFFTHADTIAELTIAYCPHVKSIIPPVSYTIATYAPQKQLWMLSLLLHFPARTLLMQMIPQMWSVLHWRFVFYAVTSVETLSLVMLSLFHVGTIPEYYVHFTCFGLWWSSTIIAMGIVVHLQRSTDHIHQD
ncbi:hypothetical protein PMAYCL1PPCAC_22333, partial [Pristionchus mayeri]